MKAILKDINKAFENKIRLGIMSILMVQEKVDFVHLKETLAVTDGNLASHLKYLEKENYIEFEKVFLNKKPNTTYWMTPNGREAFIKHIKAIEQLLS